MPEDSSCPLCRSRDTVLVGRTDDFTLLRCQRCQLAFKAERPSSTQLQAELESGYFAPESIGRQQERSHIFRGLLDLVRRELPPPGTLLDVGCAHGGLVWEAVTQGYAAFGLDLSRGELQAANGAITGRLVLGTLAESPFRPAALDVVAMFDYIEHSLTPNRDAQGVGEMLKPGGVLALFTGDYDSRKARKSGLNWDYLYNKGHINFFNQKSLETFLTMAGLKIVFKKYSLVDAAMDKKLQSLGLPTARLRSLFNRRLLFLKRFLKFILRNKAGGEGIFIIAQKA
jgi:SAM-dependent methyltransferase